MRSSSTLTAAPRDPSIPAATMLGSLALVIGRAEIRYRWGASAEAAITEALRDHPASLAIETACRVAWRMMTAPGERIGPALVGVLEALEAAAPPVASAAWGTAAAVASRRVRRREAAPRARDGEGETNG